jgi:[ribosomal protein S18]-alanine N-acetyltransferase
MTSNPPNDLVLRPMRLEDIPQVHALDVLSFSLPWPENSYQYELTQNPNSQCWVVEDTHNGAGRIVGMSVAWLIMDEVHIATLAVHPDYRRKGIAKRLLVRSLLEGYARGGRTALLEVRRGNLAAQALYFKFNFQVAGLRPRYYQDVGEDALLMTLYQIDPEAVQKLV